MIDDNIYRGKNERSTSPSYDRRVKFSVGGDTYVLGTPVSGLGELSWNSAIVGANSSGRADVQDHIKLLKTTRTTGASPLYLRNAYDAYQPESAASTEIGSFLSFAWWDAEFDAGLSSRRSLSGNVTVGAFNK